MHMLGAKCFSNQIFFNYWKRLSNEVEFLNLAFIIRGTKTKDKLALAGGQFALSPQQK